MILTAVTMLLFPALAQAGSLDVNGSGRMVFTGGEAASQIVVNYKEGTEYPYRVSDGAFPVSVPESSDKCREVGDTAQCKGVTIKPFFDLRGNRDAFLSIATGGLESVVSGGEGTDYLRGGSLGDQLNGGPDEDIIIAGNGRNEINGGGSIDLIVTTAKGQDTVTCTDSDMVFMGQDDIHVGCRPISKSKNFTNTCQGQDWIYDTGKRKLVLSSITDLAVGGSSQDIFFGLPGDDCLWGRAGADLLYGEEGKDLLISGTGWDVLKGGRGNDWLIGEQEISPTDSKSFITQDDKWDKVLCAPGDLVLADRKDSVVGCSPYIVSAESCQTYRGGNNGSQILQARRETFARLFGGDDSFSGSRYGDCVWGEDGNDKLLAAGGRDIVVGGPGDDAVAGGAGPDSVVGSAGKDRIYGGTGNDVIRSVDGERDLVKCGRGRDRVLADPADKIYRGCERVRRS